VESYQGTCFGHAFSKAYQYAMIDVKVCKDFTYLSIKNVQRFVKVYNLAKNMGKVDKNGTKQELNLVWPQRS